MGFSRQEYWFAIPISSGPHFVSGPRFVSSSGSRFGLKLNIQKMKIMASGPITSWQVDGDTMEMVTDFIFLGSKISVMVTAAKKLKDAFSLEGKL